MKVAVCISGHLRDGDELTYPSLKANLLDKYDCDIFISGWKESGIDKLFSYGLDVPITDEDMTQRILDTYNPIRHHMDSASSNCIESLKKNWGECKTTVGAYVYQIACMQRKIYYADLLRRIHEAESGTKYDAVVRLRFDIAPTSNIIEKTRTEITDNNIIVKDGHLGKKDQFFWGSPSAMSDMCECFLYLNNVIERSSVTQFNGESILWSYMQHKNIKFSSRNDIEFRQIKPNQDYIV